MYVYCIKRPKALAALLERQTDFFQRPDLFATPKKEEGFFVTPEKEERMEVDSSGGDERVLLASDVKGEAGKDDQKDNIEETRVDKKEEGANNNKEAKEGKEEEQQQIVSNVSPKDPIIGTEEEGGEVGDKVVEPPLPPPPVARKLLLSAVVFVGLLATWYARKVQRKRSGWHKKIDATLSLAWFSNRQGRARPGHGKEARRKLVD
jgi:hypothetical protein